MIDKDKFSSVIKKSTDLLFVKNPQGTSLGTFCGVLLDGLIKLFKPQLVSIKVIDISAFTLPYTIALGIVVFNIKNYLTRYDLGPDRKKFNFHKNCQCRRKS